MSIPLHTIKALNTDYARPSRYWVQIGLPRVLQGTKEGYRVKDIELNCNSAQFPAVALGTSEHRTKGPLRKMPYDQIYTDLNLTFYNDSSFKEKRFFDTWMNKIVNNETKNYEFYDNYISYVIIAQLNMAGRVTYAVKLEEAYPTNVGEIALSYDNTDQIEIFPVTFTYRNWREIDSTDPLNIFKQVISQGIAKFF